MPRLLDLLPDELHASSLLAGHWIPVRDGDPRAKGLQRRHYSTHHYQDGRRPLKIMGPGEYLLLLTVDGRALFGWVFSPRPRRDGQTGVSCNIFRNEGPIQSSLLIREAAGLAWERWPGQRLYTYVNPSKVLSANPGYCFKVAGWRFVKRSPSSLHVLEMLPEHSVVGVARAGEQRTGAYLVQPAVERSIQGVLV